MQYGAHFPVSKVGDNMLLLNVASTILHLCIVLKYLAASYVLKQLIV